MCMHIGIVFFTVLYCISCKINWVKRKGLNMAYKVSDANVEFQTGVWVLASRVFFLFSLIACHRIAKLSADRESANGMSSSHTSASRIVRSAVATAVAAAAAVCLSYWRVNLLGRPSSGQTLEWSGIAAALKWPNHINNCRTGDIRQGRRRGRYMNYRRRKFEHIRAPFSLTVNIVLRWQRFIAQCSLHLTSVSDWNRLLIYLIHGENTIFQTRFFFNICWNLRKIREVSEIRGNFPGPVLYECKLTRRLAATNRSRVSIRAAKNFGKGSGRLSTL